MTAVICAVFRRGKGYCVSTVIPVSAPLSLPPPPDYVSK